MWTEEDKGNVYVCVVFLQKPEVKKLSVSAPEIISPLFKTVFLIKPTDRNM